jgi:hypothetical protein
VNAIPARLRNPVLWLVVGIPLATLAGGYWTLRLAYQGGNDEVPDYVTRTGQAQVAEFSPDRAAARAGLRLSLSFDAVAGRVTAMQEAGRPLPAQPLALRFVHPLRAGEDRTIALLPVGAGWQAAMPRIADNAWRLVLSDAGDQWRVVGQRSSHATAVTLRPSLPP